MQDIPLTEARARLGELVDQVRYGGDGVLITRSGRTAAALVPPHVYEQWVRRRSEMRSFIASIRERVAETGMTEEEIAALVNEAIDEVRREQPEPAPAVGAAPR